MGWIEKLIWLGVESDPRHLRFLVGLLLFSLLKAKESRIKQEFFLPGQEGMGSVGVAVSILLCLSQKDKLCPEHTVGEASTPLPFCLLLAVHLVPGCSLDRWREMLG